MSQSHSKNKEAISKNQISQLEIDQRCRKILSAKKWFGLDRLSEVDKANLDEELTTKKTKVLNRKLIRIRLLSCKIIMS